MQILLIGGAGLDVRAAARALAFEGHSVVVERDGIAGRDRALGEQFDLLIVDVGLARLDGISLCREVRARGVRTPMVAVSFSTLPDAVDRALVAGFDDYLVKPIGHEELRWMARRYAPRRAEPGVRPGWVMRI